MPTGDLFVEHWHKAKAGDVDAVRGKVKKANSIPPAVKSYRANIGGVDLFDQYQAYYKLQHRSFKYWHAMFFFILEAALVNAWVLYKGSRERANLVVEFTHFQFRAEVAKSLARDWENCSF